MADEHDRLVATIKRLPLKLLHPRPIAETISSAGGVPTIAWQILMKEELGRRWLEPDLFRFGASSLLTDIERQLEHHLTGRYSANHRHAMA